MEKVVKRYTAKDAGCYADGAHGNAYLALKMREMLPAGIAIEDLDSPESEFFYEALDEALAALDTLCEPGCRFIFRDGDLILAENEDEDDKYWEFAEADADEMLPCGSEDDEERTTREEY